MLVVAHQDENKTGISTIRNKIVTAQFECYQKITKDTLLNRRGRTSTDRRVKKQIAVTWRSGEWKGNCTITFSLLTTEKQK